MFRFKKDEYVRIIDEYDCYKGKYYNCVGIIVTNYCCSGISPDNGKLGIRINGHNNARSKEGLFWFKSKHLKKITRTTYDSVVSTSTLTAISGVFSNCQQIDLSKKIDWNKDQLADLSNLFSTKGKESIELNIFDDKEERNNMENVIKTPKTMTILERWLNLELKDISNAYKIEYDRVKILDDNYRLAETCVLELKRLLNPNSNYQVSKLEEILTMIEVSSEIGVLLCNISNERDNEIEKTQDKAKEIRTMLIPCETYEQELDILKAYKIIRADGTYNNKLLINLY